MLRKPETLLILSPGFPKDKQDTTCIPPQQQFVKALTETFPGLQIIVLAFQYPFEAAEYEWYGAKVITLGGKSRARFGRLKTWFRAGLRVIQLRRKYRIIGLLSFWLGECALMGQLFSKILRVKHFCWILGQDAKAGNKYVRWIGPDGNELIALSDFIQREFEKNYRIRPQHIIPVGITPELFSDTKYGEAPTHRDISIMGAGSLIPLKQYHLFVEVIARLKPAFPDIKAVICGDGPEMARLTSMIRTLDLENNIEMKGELPHSEVLACMQHSQILLHTSEYEGFGAVCLEALYAGASVISFVKPMDETIKNWYVVSKVEEMLDQVKTILNNPSLDYQPVIPFEVTRNVRMMMDLIGYKEAAI